VTIEADRAGESVSYVDAGLAAGVTYYYTVFTFDDAEPPNYSSGITMESTPKDDIMAPTVEVFVPNGGEHWAGSSIQRITWEAEDDTRDIVMITIRYSMDSGDSWTLVTEEAVNPGAPTSCYYDWLVPYLNNTTMRISVEATDGSGKMGYDMSDNDFEIVSSTPEAPTSVEARALPAANPTYVQVYWTASVSLPQGYNVYRRTESTGYAKVNVDVVTIESYDDTTVLTTESYYYVVKAVDLAFNESLWSTPEASAPYFALTHAPTVETPAVMRVMWGDGRLIPGAKIRYEIRYTNNGFAPAYNIYLTDKIPLNTDFKVGSPTWEGLSVTTVEYSNDNGSTYGYVPSVPSGYTDVDPAVNNIKWRIDHVAPRATGSFFYEVVLR
jgi:uncharacterized repeat protein (TIGR01451 family)